ncbi:MAG TPA: DUF1003 domain-containing protein [Candidatus Paceibacterota bacterium]|nr:DUF1003 domain-containing protein [Candidatus Paceibacterota bacterium]
MTRKERKIRIRKASDKFVRWIGSPSSLFVHTVFFAIMMGLALNNSVNFDKVMLVLTTIVSLEAIYLSIFIQMTVNKHAEELEEVSEDIEEIQEDVEEIEKDVDEIQKDVDEIQEDVDEIQEDVEEIQEDSENEESEQKKDDELMQKIEENLGKLIEEVLELKEQSQTRKTRATEKANNKIKNSKTKKISK